MTKQELLELLDIYDGKDDINLNEILQSLYEERQAHMEEIEERQHKTGFYAQQDLIEIYRRER